MGGSSYKWRKKLGLCTACPKRVETKGDALCEACCAEKKAKRVARCAERNREGMCIFCDRPLKEGTMMCEVHLAVRKASNERQRAKTKGLPPPKPAPRPGDHDYARKQRRAAGICISCPEKAVPGSGRCPYHWEQHKKHCAQRHNRLKAQGLCVHCKAPVKDLTECEACRAKYAGARKKQRAQQELFTEAPVKKEQNGKPESSGAKAEGKKAAKRARRRAEKKDPQEAPKKNRYRGYTN
jgi:hypothetical protein